MLRCITLLCSVVCVLTTFGISGAVGADLGSKDDVSLQSMHGFVYSWSGAYVKAGVGMDITSVDSVWDDSTLSYSERGYGVALEGGYRFQASRAIVLGGYSAMTYSNTVERTGWSAGATAGLALGNAQPYVLAGYERLDETDGLVLGGGVDVHLSQHIIAGLQWQHVEWYVASDNADNAFSDRFTAQIGYQF